MEEQETETVLSAVEVEETHINGSYDLETCDPASVEASSELPVMCALFPNKTLLELGKAEWINSTEKSQPYVRGCTWSPDGTCCLSVVNSAGVHLTELPPDLYSGQASRHRDVDCLSSVVRVPEGGLVYDFCWYPGMNSALPETCCWLTTRQHGPLQLWDAFDGGLRCSYRGFDAVDEMEPALSCTFSTDGTQIYAGYKKCLRTFQSSRPGRDCSTHKLSAPASCLTARDKLLAVGSWNTSLSLYCISETGTFKSVGKMHGHSGGITHAKFSPDGTKLVSGARKDDRLLIWDLRFYRRPLNILPRRMGTNQRVYFDISSCGRYLVSGATDGVLRIWDSVTSEWSSANAGYCEGSASFQFPLHDDCLNSVSLHPFRPIIATGSGQYHARDPIASLQDSLDHVNDQSEKSSDQSNETVNLSEKNCDRSVEVEVTGEVKCENSLVFWWIGDVPDL